ncbi:MAG: hypothetical protein L0Z07_07965 [Planctomycetes bacterium]|nr:hypothetical protein [Planctomycetota bacterium]
MHSIWHSLAWKEWHEHKWKLASLAAVLCSIAAMVMWTCDRGTLSGSQFVLAMNFLLAMVIVPLAVFVGLGTATSERSRGTLPFLQALPVPMWRVALHKLAFGLIAIVVPAMLCVALIYVWYLGLRYLEYFVTAKMLGPRSFSFGLDNWFVDGALMVTFVGASFFIWTIAAGVNRRDEVSAGAVALAVMVGWFLLLWLALFWILHWLGHPNRAGEWLATVGLSTAPGGLAIRFDPNERWRHYRLVGLISAAISHAALATWYVRRFGKIADRKIWSPQVAASDGSLPDWIPPPRRSPLAAISWKQFRESGPIALGGLASIVGVVVWRIVGNPGIVFELRDNYAGVPILLGYMIALVVGIGVFLYDVGPGLNTFWRSRPINPNVWFWTKFLSGLAIVMATIYVPILIIALLRGINRPFRDLDASFVAMHMALHIAIFAAAVMTTCLVRHAVYAAILSVAIVYLGYVATAMALALNRVLHGDAGLEYFSSVYDKITPLQFAAGLLGSFVISTLIAWLAVRYDWGRKSRY